MSVTEMKEKYFPDIVRDSSIATNFMAHSYKSLNEVPKYYMKVNSLRKSGEEGAMAGDWEGRSRHSPGLLHGNCWS